MNRSWSKLDHVSVISNSDAHSPEKFGREANVFEIDPAKYSFDEFIRILRERDRAAFLYTIEFFPEEGKYHIDGHADCNVALHPTETRKRGGMCPKCGRPLTVGVLSRVAELSDRDIREVPARFVPQKSIVPLPEVIAEVLRVRSPSSKKVIAQYEKMIAHLGNEFHILLDASLSDIKSFAGEDMAEAVRRVRTAELSITPGYDGIYGKVKIFGADELPKSTKQANLL